MEKTLAARGDNGGEGVRAPSSGAEKTDLPSLGVKVTQWAAKTLPDVRVHLEQAEQVYSALAK